MKVMNLMIKKIVLAGFEEVWSCEESLSGLRAYIAVHSTRLGPALGGIRMFPYESAQLALADACRLARAMTYKAAAAHLRLGGGKAVILGDPEKDKTEALLEAMGAFIDTLGGRYIAAKDAGIVTSDLIRIYDRTTHVAGLPASLGGSADPSPWTAAGILEGIKACVNEEKGEVSLKGLKILIQGVGHVGYELAQLLYKEGTVLYISDPSAKALEKATQSFPAEAVHPASLFSRRYDIYSPCAMGHAINDAVINRLSCRIIAGGANNQLEDEDRHGKELARLGILYAPDYVINAGGIINIYVKDILKKEDPMPWIRRIGTFLTEIFEASRRDFLDPAKAANIYTEEILARGTVSDPF